MKTGQEDIMVRRNKRQSPNPYDTNQNRPSVQVSTKSAASKPTLCILWKERKKERETNQEEVGRKYVNQIYNERHERHELLRTWCEENPINTVQVTVRGNNILLYDFGILKENEKQPINSPAPIART